MGNAGFRFRTFMPPVLQSDTLILRHKRQPSCLVHGSEQWVIVILKSHGGIRLLELSLSRPCMHIGGVEVYAMRHAAALG